MRYEARKIILGILVLGILLTGQVLAGTGPNPNSASEGFYFEATRKGTTSTDVLIHWPTISDYSDPYIWYVNFIDDYGGGSGSVLHSATTTLVSIPYTTGTIVIGSNFGDGVNLSASSTPINWFADYFVHGSSTDTGKVNYNWTSAYWDIDTLDLSSTVSSTESLFYWSYPYNATSPIVISAPTNFVVNDLNIRSAGNEYRVFFEIYGMNTSTLRYSFGTMWSESSGLDQEQVTIAGLPYDLYERSTSTPYNVLARLQEREYGSYVYDTIAEDWVYFIVESAQDTSTLTGKPKPLPTSSPERAEVYQDCGNWYEFQLGCHLENFTVYLLIPDYMQPNAQTISPLSSVWTNYFDVFPFSVFSAYRQNFEDQISNVSSSNELNFELTIASSTFSVPIAGRDYMVDIFGLENTNTYYNWFLGALSSAIVLAMVNGIIKLFF